MPTISPYISGNPGYAGGQSIIFHDIKTHQDVKPPGFDVYNKSAIINQMNNVLTTIPGEHAALWEPEFGSRIPFLLFEPISPQTAWEIENEAYVAIARWMKDRITLLRSNILANVDVSMPGYNVVMNPVINLSGETITVSIPLVK